MSENDLSKTATRVGLKKPVDQKFSTVQEDVLSGDDSGIETHILELVKNGVNPGDILQKGLIAAMEIIGPKFKSGEIFIPEVLLSSRAMKKGIAVLEPHMSDEQRKSRGKVLIGTVKGDLHDIGKNMVATMLRGVGFDILDLGIDVDFKIFIKKIREYRPDIVGLSALLTTTMPEMKKIIDELQGMGLRDQVKVMVGGAPVSGKFAQGIRADGYAPDAASAVKLAQGLIV
jgi:5-methyltetrahydrofolate--homocysteine methyltransferase